MKKYIKQFTAISIRNKLFLLFAILLGCSIALLGFLEERSTMRTIQGESLEKARSDVRLGLQVLDLTYPGFWSVQEGKLYKGDTLISGNNDALSKIGELTNGDVVTIYLGHSSVATNALGEQGNVSNIKASDEVVGQVIKQGVTHLGQTEVMGHTYQGVYVPLKAQSGEVIGMWYVGAPDSSERVDQIRGDILKKIIVQAIIVLIVAMIFNYFLTRPIVRRIEASRDALQLIADGDLTLESIPYKSKDESGALLGAVNKVSSDLRTMISDVKETSFQVAASSEQLAASSDETSRATEQISIAVQEVAAGSDHQLQNFMNANLVMREISSGMDQVARNVQTMSQFSTEAVDEASTGTDTVTHAIEQMNVVKQTVDEAATDIQLLEKKMQEINQMVVLITEISDQTHLLSLNAAIEAARAGEHGKGFAVVADEVRKLSEQSSQSTDLIRKLILQVQSQALKAVTSMNKGSLVVEEGMSRVHQSGEAFTVIAQKVGEISTQTQDITGIVSQVHKGTGQIVEMMEQLSTISTQSSANAQTVAASAEQQNAAMQEISASATELGHMADKLQKLVDKFKV